MVKRTIFCLLLALCGAAFAQVDEGAARQLFERINLARAEAGVGQLEWDERLAAVARPHAEAMARREQLSHQFQGEPAVRKRIIASGLRTDASGENVAFGPDVEILFNGWMESAPHRANILDPKYNASAIAVVRRGESLWAVQDFARKVASYSDNEVESIVGSQLARARAEAGLAELRQAHAPDVHTAACDMAERGQMQASTLVRRWEDVRSVFTFTAAEPQKLPQDLISTAPDAKAFAVGSCFGKNEKYPEGTNWVVVAFY